MAIAPAGWRSAARACVSPLLLLLLLLLALLLDGKLWRTKPRRCRLAPAATVRVRTREQMPPHPAQHQLTGTPLEQA